MLTLTMLPNSGHQAQNDESDKFNEIALAFFRGKMDRTSRPPVDDPYVSRSAEGPICEIGLSVREQGWLML